MYDTKFVIEIANCPVDGITSPLEKQIPKTKVTAHNMGYRMRLGSEKHNTDYWFDYGKKSLFSNSFNKIAKEIIELWDEAENWWYKDPYGQKEIK